MKRVLFLITALVQPLLFTSVQAQEEPVKKLNVLIIGAHPDDPDEIGGCAYKWAQSGHNVMMVSITNGDAGHQSIKAAELSRIRREEARKAGFKII